MFCEQVLELLREAGIPHREIEVNDAVEQMKLMEKCDARSFPVVFVDDVYIGGFTHIVHLHSQRRLLDLLGNDFESERPERRSSRPSEAPSNPVTEAANLVQAFAAWGEYKARRG